MRRRVCAFCVAVMVTAASWSAVAGDKEEAKQLFDAGLKLMHLDDFAGASANFERSVALYPTQNSLFNLANCYKALQRYGEAIAAIERLRREFSGKLKPEIKDAVERQQQEINSLVARLTLQTVPADATIRIDGKDMGTGPTLGPLLLGPGEHEIEAARSGYRSQRRSVKLVSGAGRTEKFVLQGASGNLVVRANVAARRCSWTAGRLARRPWTSRSRCRQASMCSTCAPPAMRTPSVRSRCSPIPNKFSISC